MASKLREQLDDALERIDELEAELEAVVAVEQNGARIAVQWQEFPNARVGIDVSGNVVRVELSGLDSWVAE